MASTHRVPVHKLPEVDFEVVREDWAKYRLTDGAILGLKPVLVKLFLADKGTGSEPPKLVVGHQNVVVIRSEERSEPRLPERPLDELPEEIKEEVEVAETLQERWNSYRVRIGGETYIFEMKPVIIRVLRVKGYYDQSGYPVYQVYSTIVTRIKRERG